MYYLPDSIPIEYRHPYAKKGFVKGKSLKNEYESMSEIPTESEESRDLSKDLKRRGFGFVGPTICYSFMQAVGLVNDHVKGCLRHNVEDS